MANMDNRGTKTSKDQPLASGLLSGLRFGLGVGVVGAVLLALACLGGSLVVSRVLRVDLSQASRPSSYIELQVQEDGCQVRALQANSVSVQNPRWVVMNLDGERLHTEPAEEPLDYRYSESGVFEIIMEAEVDGRFEEVSNGVRVFCEPEDGS